MFARLDLSYKRRKRTSLFDIRKRIKKKTVKTFEKLNFKTKITETTIIVYQIRR